MKTHTSTVVARFMGISSTHPNGFQKGKVYKLQLQEYEFSLWERLVQLFRSEKSPIAQVNRKNQEDGVKRYPRKVYYDRPSFEADWRTERNGFMRNTRRGEGKPQWRTSVM